MSQYYSANEIKDAKQVDLVELLQKLGVQLKKHGNEYILPHHDSLKISRTNGWYWNSRQTGGNAIDFLVNGPEFSYNFREAIEVIRKTMGMENGIDGVELKRSQNGNEKNNEKENKAKEKSLALPIINQDNKRVIAYLNQSRGIDYAIIKKCINDGILYEAANTHNAVFVGKDFTGKSRYAFQRGTVTGKRFAGDVDGSDKGFGFRIEGSTNKLQVFEAPIDALSFLTMENNKGVECKDTLISLGGVSLNALNVYLESDKGQGISVIHIRTDNDDAGKNCYEKIKEKYGSSHDVIHNPPRNKDYNLDLIENNKIQKER